MVGGRKLEGEGWRAKAERVKRERRCPAGDMKVGGRQKRRKYENDTFVLQCYSEDSVPVGDLFYHKVTIIPIHYTLEQSCKKLKRQHWHNFVPAKLALKIL